MTKRAWGKHVSPEVLKAVEFMSARLSADPNHIMAVMAFETGRTFSPSIRNKVSGATGLIQFMAPTAKGLGTTQAKLAAMTALEQLKFVEAHFQPYKGRMKTLSDVYMAVLWPAAVGKPESYPLFTLSNTKRKRAYEQNAGLDLNKDRVVTKAEAAAKVARMLEIGLQDANATKVPL